MGPGPGDPRGTGNGTGNPTQDRDQEPEPPEQARSPLTGNGTGNPTRERESCVEPGSPHGLLHPSTPDPLPLPVRILRLPRGPDSSGSRGFSCPSRCPSRNLPGDSPELLQSARAALRERFLRLLGSARGRRARFSLCSGVLLDAELGAAPVESGPFQVDRLRTPLGMQAAALLRASDVLAFSFPLE
ncbi:gem-associated protein 7-like [Aphelocoma coerulescens]|uniref:gem-associated protein 7-like n=1 Tax=Aphelocoma coerulescens TaxID=39617 RepID=UPI003604D4ED